MKKRILAGFVVLVLSAEIADAIDLNKSGISVSQAWSRATPATFKMGAAYLTLLGANKAADRLIGVSSPDAGRVEIHRHGTKDGAMKMTRIDSVVIPARKSVIFKTGGLHLMLFDLKHRLIAGHDLKLILEFEKAGRVEVRAKIEPAWSLGPAPPQ